MTRANAAVVDLESDVDAVIAENQDDFFRIPEIQGPDFCVDHGMHRRLSCHGM